MPATALYDAASAVLATTLAALTAPPGRAYVTVGAAAFDCDQLTVGVSLVDQTRPGDRTLPQRVGPAADLATIRIDRVRCVPAASVVGNPPDASLVDAEAAELYQDGYSMWRALRVAMLDPDWLGGTCHPAGLDQMTPIDAQGGLWGWSITMRAVVDSEQWSPGA